MKIITRTRKTGEYLGYYILEDNEEIKVQELEELPYKEGHYIETYFDYKEKIVQQRYVEIPKKRTNFRGRTQEDTRASRTSKQSYRRLGYEKCRIVGDKNACLY